MNRTSERFQQKDVFQLKDQISKLEDLYVDLFLVGCDNNEELKRIHVQLEVLKVELKLRLN